MRVLHSQGFSSLNTWRLAEPYDAGWVSREHFGTVGQCYWWPNSVCQQWDLPYTASNWSEKFWFTRRST